MTAPPLEKTGRERRTAAVHMNEKFLLTIKVYYSPTNAQVIVLKNNTKIYIKIATTYACCAVRE
jgi:hypothetical protein